MNDLITIPGSDTPVDLHRGTARLLLTVRSVSVTGHCIVIVSCRRDALNSRSYTIVFVRVFEFKPIEMTCDLIYFYFSPSLGSSSPRYLAFTYSDVNGLLRCSLCVCCLVLHFHHSVKLLRSNCRLYSVQRASMAYSSFLNHSFRSFT